MNKHATQGAVLAEALKRKPHTYLGMLAYGVSASPWKRISEWLELHPCWKLVKGEQKGLVTWRVVKA